MTKNKKTSAVRTAKTLAFPPHVVAVKEDLEKSKDPLLSTMKKLTEAEDLPQENALKEMWLVLEAAEREKYGKLSDDCWVRYFVLYVSSYSKFPPYYHQRAADKIQLIKDLNKNTKQMIIKLQKNGFDYHLAYSEQRRLVSFYEHLDFSERREADKKGKITVSAILNGLMQSAEREIKTSKTSRADKHAEARLFVEYMATYLQNTYGKPMHSVLITAAYAIHGAPYGKDEIRRILSRKSKVKDGDDFSSLTLS